MRTIAVPMRALLSRHRDPVLLLWTLVTIGLAATMGVGTWLRWWLAGVALPVHNFGSLRHLHTHLGYYSVLFPLMWLAWIRLVKVRLPPWRIAVYAYATAVSAIGFAREGYGLIANIGSAVVLLIWILSAWDLRSQLGRNSWLGSVSLAIPAGAAMVPFVALNTGTSRASEFVRSFLGILLLGALLPTALAWCRARPFPVWGWGSIVLVAGLSLGAWQTAGIQAALLVVGLLLAAAGGSAPQAAPIRLAWVLGGLGLFVVGHGWLPLQGPVAVAGTHFLVLGPLMLSIWPRPLQVRTQAVLLLLVATMSTAILAPSLGIPRVGVAWAEVTAASGTLVAIAYGYVAFGELARLVRTPQSAND